MTPLSARLIILGAVMFVLIAGLGIWIGKMFGRVQQYAPVAARLPAELAAARSEGLPLTPADLRRPYRVPPSENAAPLYRRIDSILKALPKTESAEDGAVNKLARSARPAEKALARRIVQRRSKVLALVDQAAARTHCDFEREFDKGPDLMLPEYASMRQAARLLAGRALLRAEDGDLEGAFQSIATGAKIGRHAGEDPILIALLVNIAIYSIMDSAFHDLLLRSSTDPRARSLAARTLKFPELPALAHCYRGEVVMGRVVTGRIRESGSFIEELSPLLRGKSAKTRAAMADAWDVRMLQYWRKCFAALRQAGSDPVLQVRALKPASDELEGRMGEPTYELAAIIMPVFSQVGMKLASAHEQERLRQTILLIAQYRRVNQAWPPSLSQLAAPVEPDMFTGQPPIYRRTPDGFILYSVGDNLKDDGG